MPVELLARHGIEFDDVKPIVEAFTAGDVQRALELTSSELGAALSVAGTARDWVAKPSDRRRRKTSGGMPTVRDAMD